MSTLNSQLEKKLPQKVVLASGSPRRKELLGQVLSDFEVLVSDVDETALSSNDPWQTATHLALAKARAVFEQRPEAVVIGGDTVVALPMGGEYLQLAKPNNAEHAVQMLTLLSGATHLVITGVAIVGPQGEDPWHETSRVTFRPLGVDEIETYVATGEPMDKAGAYAIQGGAAKFVEKLDGSLTNVIGLPVEELRERLMAFAPDLLR